MPRSHSLKVAPQFFVEVLAGRKTQEFRLNDRDFQVGDLIQLQEYVPPDYTKEGDFTVVSGLTGRHLTRVISHILDHETFPPVPEGWAILSLADVVPEPDVESNVVALTTTGHIPPGRVLNAALDAIPGDDLREVVVAGWCGEPGSATFFMSSSEGTPDTMLILERARAEVMRVVISAEGE